MVLVVKTDMYKEFVNALAVQLYGTDSLEWFLNNRTRGHRTERLINMLLLRDRETYHKYKDVLPENYGVIRSALYADKKNMVGKLCNQFVEEYGVREPAKEATYEDVQQLLKGLSTYVAFRIKR